MTLEERIAKLESTQRRWKILAIPMLVLLAYIFARGTIFPSNRIVTNELVVEDDKGLPRFEVSFGYPYASYFPGTPSSSKPVVLWVNDFHEGTTAIINSEEISFFNSKTQTTYRVPSVFDDVNDIQHEDSRDGLEAAQDPVR